MYIWKKLTSEKTGGNKLQWEVFGTLENDLFKTLSCRHLLIQKQHWKLQKSKLISRIVLLYPCRVHWTGFFMITASVMKELIEKLLLQAN